MIVRNALLPGLAALLCAAVPAAAQTQRFEDINGLEAMVVARLGAAVGQPGGPMAPIDRRLRLAACADSPLIEGPEMGAAVVRCPTAGWRIRVPLRAAAMAQASQKSGPVVRRGDPVEVTAGGANFSVTTMMVADEDGAPGDMIRVRADRRADPVVAQVMKAGVVSVPGFN